MTRVKTIGGGVKVWWLLLAFLSGFALAMWAEELILSWKDDRLQFSAPRLHFLSGKPLERLKDGSQVPYNFQITLWSGNRNHVFRRIAEQFVVSYDLWEERFSVSKASGRRATKSHMVAAAAEAWCLDQMPLDTSGLAGAELFWARLEIRAEDGKEPPPFGRGNISPSGINLTSLIEIFSRPAAAGQSHWAVDAGPLTLDELKRGHGRGS